MHREIAIGARKMPRPPEPSQFQLGALHYCGFTCPHCGYQHRLSDNSNGVPIIDMFRADTKAHALICPECNARTSYERTDLKLFRNELD